MLDTETPLPQPQTPLQPTQPVFPPLLDMCPGLSPAARLSLTPSRGLIASSLLWKQNLSGDLTADRMRLQPEARVSVPILWSKVTVKAVDTTLLPNNRLSRAVGSESLSPGPGGASCHNFVQGVGLSFGKLWSGEPVANPSPRPISSRGERHRSRRHEKCSAQVVKVHAISSWRPYQRALAVAFDLKEESGPSDGNDGTWFCICGAKSRQGSSFPPTTRFQPSELRRRILRTSPREARLGPLSQAEGTPVPWVPSFILPQELHRFGWSLRHAEPQFPHEQNGSHFACESGSAVTAPAESPACGRRATRAR